MTFEQKQTIKSIISDCSNAELDEITKLVNNAKMNIAKNLSGAIDRSNFDSIYKACIDMLETLPAKNNSYSRSIIDAIDNILCYGYPRHKIIEFDHLLESIEYDEECTNEDRIKVANIIFDEISKGYTSATYDW